MATYGMSVRWTAKNGDATAVTIDGCDTAREAWDAAIGMAKKSGWTPPKWWQWWRRQDQPRTDQF